MARPHAHTIAREPFVELEARYLHSGEQILDRLRDAQRASGHIRPSDTAQVAADLELPRAHVHGSASFYADLRAGCESTMLCAGTACFAATKLRHFRQLEGGLSTEPSGRKAPVRSVYCLGYCYAAPAALRHGKPHAGADLAEQLTGHTPRQDPPIPFRCAAPEAVVLAGLVGSGPPAWGAWQQIVGAVEPKTLRDEILRAGLRGRGGAGFEVGRKWELAARGDPPRYVICNGDEGDPGSFIDRLLMESDPHRVLEGTALAALAVGASRAFVYVRSEYPRARDSLRKALSEAYSAGHLGRDVYSSGIALEIEVFEGAGSYVAGEETALIHSIEGLRGGVRARPPFPTHQGLFDAPTAVNNVETLVAVPWILANGADRYARLGKQAATGTKVVCLNERFRYPGAYEVELGESVRRIYEELGGGLKEGDLRSLQVGGPLGGFLAADELDIPLTFEDLSAAGAALGHASFVGFDHRVSAVELLTHIWGFAANESCGTCAPCRIGSRRGLEIAERVATGRYGPEELDTHQSLCEAMAKASLCAFGQSVPLAVRSLLRVYGDELGRRELR